MKSTLIRAAAAMLVITAAAPAFAADKGATATQTKLADDPARKYCLSSDQLPAPVVTGTIITQPKRQCLTRDQWAARGVGFRVK